MFTKEEVKLIKEVSILIEAPQTPSIEKTLKDNGFKFEYVDGSYVLYDYDSYAAIIDLFESVE